MLIAYAIVILAFFRMIPLIENITENNMKNVKTHPKSIEIRERWPFCYMGNTDVIPRTLE